MDLMRLRNMMQSAGATPSDGFPMMQADIVRHVQAVETARTTLDTGGTLKYFYDTYVAPYSGEAGCILVAVSNNMAGGNKARYIAVFDKLLAPPRDGYVKTMRGSDVLFIDRQIDDIIDFFTSEGSIVDVWVFNLTLLA